MTNLPVISALINTLAGTLGGGGASPHTQVSLPAGILARTSQALASTPAGR